MKEIKPTKKEVFDELRKTCCWLGGKGCECKSRSLKDCYLAEEKRLTRFERTPEEIQQGIEQNKRAMQEIDDILNEIFGKYDE